MSGDTAYLDFKYAFRVLYTVLNRWLYHGTNTDCYYNPIRYIYINVQSNIGKLRILGQDRSQGGSDGVPRKVFSPKKIISITLIHCIVSRPCITIFLPLLEPISPLLYLVWLWAWTFLWSLGHVISIIAGSSVCNSLIIGRIGNLDNFHPFSETGIVWKVLYNNDIVGQNLVH